MNNDVDAAEAFADGIGNLRAGFRTGHIGGDEHLVAGMLATRSCGGKDFDTGISQPGDNSLANTLGAARDEGAKAPKLEISTHGRISSETIRPSSISKICSRLIGLPGKSPETLPVTTTLPSRVDTLSGSTT